MIQINYNYQHRVNTIILIASFLLAAKIILITLKPCRRHSSRDFKYKFIYNTIPSRPMVQNTENTGEPNTLEIGAAKPEMKTILLWTTYDLFEGTNGRELFLENNCKFTNCYLTEDRMYLDDVTKFDAVLFDVFIKDEMPTKPDFRSEKQKYIAIANEAPSEYDYSMMFRIFNNLFNLTWTFKLNSDILYRYFVIHDMDGREVGPRLDMKWLESFKPTSEAIIQKLRLKTKTAAWIVSNCDSSERMEYALALKGELARYNLSLDIYGNCGLSCGNSTDILDQVERDYHFYLSFESHHVEDYVTEKVLHAVQHYTVPIVLGGADYTRFLPPNSYLDASELNPEDMASTISNLMSNFTLYQDYFRWTNHYVYTHDLKAEVCNICEALNDEKLMGKTTMYGDFKLWWMGPEMVTKVRAKMLNGIELLRDIKNNKLEDLSRYLKEIYDLY